MYEWSYAKNKCFSMHFYGSNHMDIDHAVAFYAVTKVLL